MKLLDPELLVPKEVQTTLQRNHEYLQEHKAESKTTP